MDIPDTSRRFLLAMWEGGGTLPPELGLARLLLARGHDVHVLADPTVEDDALAAGCVFHPWRRAPHRTTLDPAEDLLRDWEVTSPLAMLARIRDTFVAGPASDYAADTAETLRAIDADAVLVDFMLFGAVIGAQGQGVPVAPVVPNIWSIPTPGGPAIGPGFPKATTRFGRLRDAAMLRLADRMFAPGIPALDAARRQHGLAPLASFYDQVLQTDRIFVLSSPTFDFASDVVPDHVRYLGPITDDPSWAEEAALSWTEDQEGPFVLVAFSSTFQDQAPVLRRVVEALSTLQVRAVVTLGQMLDPADVQGSTNVVVVPSAPHGPLLERADLVVTHCGHGTTLKALGAGVPLVCIPMGRDQNDTAARVVHHGAGVRIGPKARTSRIRRAVQRVLGDPRFTTAAGRLAAAITEERQQIDIAAELYPLVRDDQPGRPSGVTHPTPGG
ncbi:glycosyltransferase, MGT family [Euzebya pacifica]|uniref:Glycosyltransferase, MGT family n=1 Tax=Euzebya pacifica TaxID=1608957 RepID=A0A346Y593_9ACTN|nr:glycosyltransferase [Euzebya pacifica]AXV09640.1 glycosyltransferase, MGT family [Euzebya pacifica]